MATLREKLAWVWGFWRPLRLPTATAETFRGPAYRHLLYITIASLSYVALTNVFPLILREIIDGCQKGMSWPALRFYIWLLLAVALGDFLAFTAMLILRAYLRCVLEYRFRQNIFAHIIRLGPAFYAKFGSGDLVTRLTDDISEKSALFFASEIFRLASSLLLLMTGLYCLSTLSARIALWSLALMAVVLGLFMSRQRFLSGQFRRRQEAIARAGDFAESTFAGIRIIQAYCQEESQQRKFQELLMERKDVEMGALKAETVVHAFFGQTWQVAMAIALMTGGTLAIRGEISLGTVVAAMSYVAMLAFPLLHVGQILIHWSKTSVSLDRILELDRFRPDVREADRAIVFSDVRGNIAVDEVTMTYGPENVLLNGVSLKIEAGKRTAVVGPVGAGKSALARLLARVEDPVSGSIFLDGRPFVDLALDQLRQTIGLVTQDPILFSETIRENLLSGRDIPEERLMLALKTADFEKELAFLPHGLDTMLGVRGVNLSGGQKQRLCLARAIAGNPRVLVLDDCTASLDVETERNLWDNLLQLLPGVTLVVVTHRVNTLESMDEIYVLDRGKVVAHGNHRDLLGRCAVYSRLYGEALTKERELEFRNPMNTVDP